MSQTLLNPLLHCVFSTFERRPDIIPSVQERLWPYIGGIARDNGMSTLAVGGMEDHVHILLRQSATVTIASAMQLIKGGSSKWIHENFPDLRTFRWQQGYGAFSIGAVQIEKTVAYIHNQQKHHQTRTFQEEFLQFLESNGVVYDKRYIWS